MWTVRRRHSTDEYECHDGTRLRAIIRQDNSKQWRVTRVTSTGALGGCDSFHSFAEAKDFVTKRPGIWGV